MINDVDEMKNCEYRCKEKYKNNNFSAFPVRIIKN